MTLSIGPLIQQGLWTALAKDHPSTAVRNHLGCLVVVQQRLLSGTGWRQRWQPVTVSILRSDAESEIWRLVQDRYNRK